MPCPRCNRNLTDCPCLETPHRFTEGTAVRWRGQMGVVVSKDPRWPMVRLRLPEGGEYPFVSVLHDRLEGPESGHSAPPSWGPLVIQGGEEPTP